MRTIETHKGNELDDQLTILALDAPSYGGASHMYQISWPGNSTIIEFHTGALKDVGNVNGASIESLIAICMDRLEGFQSGAYANRYNEVALLHLQNALGSLQARTKNRQERGVEGTSAPDVEPATEPAEKREQADVRAESEALAVLRSGGSYDDAMKLSGLSFDRVVAAWNAATKENSR